MNKPIAQLVELVPTATPDTTPDADQVLRKALDQAGVATENADRLLASAGPDDFDWSTDNSVVVKPQPGVAVYENKAGDVVIRTQDITGDEDHFAFIAPEGVPAVIRALKAYAP
jgi:hypothetical protein